MYVTAHAYDALGGICVVIEETGVLSLAAGLGPRTLLRAVVPNPKDLVTCSDLLRELGLQCEAAARALEDQAGLEVIAEWQEGEAPF